MSHVFAFMVPYLLTEGGIRHIQDIITLGTLCQETRQALKTYANTTVWIDRYATSESLRRCFDLVPDPRRLQMAITNNTTRSWIHSAPIENLVALDLTTPFIDLGALAKKFPRLQRLKIITSWNNDVVFPSLVELTLQETTWLPGAIIDCPKSSLP